MNIIEIKTLLKENNIHFYTYWDKKKLTALANEHDYYRSQNLRRKKVRMLSTID